MSTDVISLLRVGTSRKCLGPLLTYGGKFAWTQAKVVLFQSSLKLLVRIYHLLVLITIGQVHIGTNWRHLIKTWLYVRVVGAPIWTSKRTKNLSNYISVEGCFIAAIRELGPHKFKTLFFIYQVVGGVFISTAFSNMKNYYICLREF